MDRALELALEQAIALLVDWTEYCGRCLCVLLIGSEFHITQVVNRPHKAVRGMLPKSILPKQLI